MCVSRLKQVDGDVFNLLSLFFSFQVDVADAGKTAEAFLKISSVYNDEDEDVKSAVLDSIGKGHLSYF